MKTLATAPTPARLGARFSGTLTVLAIVVACAACAAAQEPWPPAPQLKPAVTVQDAAPLPDSITVQPLESGDWRCTFRFHPPTEAKRIVLAGSFNGWDRQAVPMKGPNKNGEWIAQVDIPTGAYEYKYLVDDDKWVDDPVNLDRVPDGFEGYNSFVRLGRLARMKTSQAKLGDGEVDALGLSHRPSEPLFIQPHDTGELSIRYRTFAHDVQHVWLAVKGGALTEMRLASEGPLFAYWQTRVSVPVKPNSRTPDIHSLDYTFVLQDGERRVGDPYPYHRTFTGSNEFHTPEWAQRAVWYQVVLDRFRNGNPANDPNPVRPWASDWFEPSPWEGQDGQTFYEFYVFDRFYGGDLDGLEEKLPYLRELGVNALYLNPIFKAQSYHKYDTQSHVHVDDHFGTKGDYDAVAAKEDLLDPATWQWTPTDQRFLAFVKRAHELGFKVILDGVFNHVGTEHPAFQDVKTNGRNSRFADWFDVASWDPFRYRGWAGYEHLPVLRKSRDGIASPSARQYIFNITRRWMDPNGDGETNDGIDGWRLDVPNDIPRPFWVEWRQFVKKINPDALITGEIWDRADPWLDGHHFDAVMNYEFAKAAVAWIFDRTQKITASDVASRLAELRLAYPSAATYVLQNLLDSHDTDRVTSMAQNPDRPYDRQNRAQGNPQYDNTKPNPESYARARLATLLQMTYVGAPLVYYGDEVGMWGADDPTNRKPMLWKDLEPYAKPEENRVMDDQLALYKQVIALRNSHPALSGGAFVTLLADDATDVWAYLRSNESEQVLVVLNPSAQAREVRIPLPEGTPQSWNTVFGDGGSLSAANGELAVKLPAIGGVVLHAPAK